jgi:hypothetical protein
LHHHWVGYFERRIAHGRGGCFCLNTILYFSFRYIIALGFWYCRGLMLVVALTVAGGFVRFIDIGSFPGPLQWSVAIAIRVIHICHVNSKSNSDHNNGYTYLSRQIREG